MCSGKFPRTRKSSGSFCYNIGYEELKDDTISFFLEISLTMKPIIRRVPKYPKKILVGYHKTKKW